MSEPPFRPTHVSARRMVVDAKRRSWRMMAVSASTFGVRPGGRSASGATPVTLVPMQEDTKDTIGTIIGVFAIMTLVCLCVIGALSVAAAVIG